MKNQTAKGIFNRNQLKYLAIAAMLIDHVAWSFVATDSLLGQLMHFVGRLTGGVMAYFVAEGYYYTRNVKRYALRLGIFALLSWLPFVYFDYGTLPLVITEEGVQCYPYFGVLYTLFLSLLAIWLWDQGRCSQNMKILALVGICVLSVFGDWPIFDILFALIFFTYREKPVEKWSLFSAVAMLYCLISILEDPWWAGLYSFGIFLVPLLLRFGYNGKSGSKHAFHKWFFYAFYPAHLAILGVLRWVVFT